MYEGPKKNTIDEPMLSRIIWKLTPFVPVHTDLCLIGGSALTVLGMREYGSEDVDIICLNRDGRFQGIPKEINRKIANGEVAIEILKDGKVDQRITLSPNATVQNFGLNLPSANLPQDFAERAHKIKRIKWAMPDGHVKHLHTRKLFGSRITLYTPCPADLFCTKLFTGRDKDKHDLLNMIEKDHSTSRYFRRYSHELPARFKEYAALNETRAERAAKFYNYLYKHHRVIGEPLPELNP
ncbi:hypothetical protein JXA12_02790 [Candidatus Woesearchaeota archaeon]|nr:hypothetical protein [Candidatus Woesearchaeota archaeon]